MIRSASHADIAAILEIAVSSGLFPADGTDEVAGEIDSALRGELGSDHVWLIDDDNGPVGVAYYAPERFTEGTWNLYMLAISIPQQRQGRGANLVRHVERDLGARGARLLLIETSGVGSFARTRAFYQALGYDEEARIRDFYAEGEDKVVFRKALG